MRQYKAFYTYRDGNTVAPVQHLLVMAGHPAEARQIASKRLCRIGRSYGWLDWHVTHVLKVRQPARA